MKNKDKNKKKNHGQTHRIKEAIDKIEYYIDIYR